MSTLTWVGGASGDWSNVANWSPARIPTATDTVFVGGTAPVTITLAGVTMCAAIHYNPDNVVSASTLQLKSLASVSDDTTKLFCNSLLLGSNTRSANIFTFHCRFTSHNDVFTFDTAIEGQGSFASLAVNASEANTININATMSIDNRLYARKFNCTSTSVITLVSSIYSYIDTGKEVGDGIDLGGATIILNASNITYKTFYANFMGSGKILTRGTGNMGIPSVDNMTNCELDCGNNGEASFAVAYVQHLGNRLSKITIGSTTTVVVSSIQFSISTKLIGSGTLNFLHTSQSSNPSASIASDSDLSEFTGNIIVNMPFLTMKAPEGVSSSSITVVGARTLNLVGSRILQSKLKGTGAVNIMGGGDYTFGGDCSEYTGTVTVQNTARLQLGNGGTIGLTGGPVINNGSLALGLSGDMALPSFSGTGTLAHNGPGKITLSTNYAGTLGVSGGGTLQVNAGGISNFTGSFALSNNSTLSVANAGTMTMSGAVSGSGHLVKSGTGALSLTGTNSYSGNIVVNDGPLSFKGAVGGITGIESATGGSATLEIPASAAITFPTSGSGSIALSAASGAAPLTMTMADGLWLHTGGTTIGPGVTFALGSGSAVTDILDHGPLTINGVFRVNTSSALAYTRDFNGSGSIDVVAAQSFSTSGNYNITGTITLAPGLNFTQSGTCAASITANNNTITVASITGAITASGSSIINISGAASGAIVASGTAVLNVKAGGSTTNSVAVSGTGSLNVEAGGQLTGSVTLNDTAPLTVAATGSITGHVTASGANHVTVTSGAVVDDITLTGINPRVDIGGVAGDIQHSGTGATITIATGATAGVVAVGDSSSITVSGTTSAAAVGWDSTLTVAAGGSAGNVNVGDRSVLLVSGTAANLLAGNSVSISVPTGASVGAIATGSGGSVVLNGDCSGNISTSARLSGSGTVGGNVTIHDGGAHAVGNSPGIMEIVGDLAYSTGATIEWDLISNATTGRGSNWDAINVSGNIRFDVGVTLLPVLISPVDLQNSFWSSQRSWDFIYYNTYDGSIGTNLATLRAPRMLVDGLYRYTDQFRIVHNTADEVVQVRWSITVPTVSLVFSDWLPVGSNDGLYDTATSGLGAPVAQSVVDANLSPITELQLRTALTSYVATRLADDGSQIPNIANLVLSGTARTMESGKTAVTNRGLYYVSDKAADAGQTVTGARVHLHHISAVGGDANMLCSYYVPPGYATPVSIREIPQLNVVVPNSKTSGLVRGSHFILPTGVNATVKRTTTIGSASIEYLAPASAAAISTIIPAAGTSEEQSGRFGFVLINKGWSKLANIATVSNGTGVGGVLDASVLKWSSLVDYCRFMQSDFNNYAGYLGTSSSDPTDKSHFAMAYLATLASKKPVVNAARGVELVMIEDLPHQLAGTSGWERSDKDYNDMLVTLTYSKIQVPL